MPKDHLRLINMTFYGRHGVHAHEREMGRTLSVDVDLTLDMRPAGSTDELEQALDYSRVYDVVKEIEGSRQFKLLEALAETIAQKLLETFTQVVEVIVRARKRTFGGRLGGMR